MSDESKPIMGRITFECAPEKHIDFEWKCQFCDTPLPMDIRLICGDCTARWYMSQAELARKDKRIAEQEAELKEVYARLDERISRR